MKPCKLRGNVIRGAGRGKHLGFPTANFILHSQIPDGIYISQTKIADREYPSVTFIGAARTFGQTERYAETYIMNFTQDIYGQSITVRLIKKIRENHWLSSRIALVN